MRRVLEDVGRAGWVTAAIEVKELATWLRRLNDRGDVRLRAIFDSMEDASSDQWDSVLVPTTKQGRRVLDETVTEGKLKELTWYQEVGRPTLAYVLPGKAPFLERRCGQCAFYASAKRRCNLWWLVNKRRVYFDERWGQPNSTVSRFELHKMKFASTIGPHSSACLRFIDKKRDHFRAAVPEWCEICGTRVSSRQTKAATCSNCKTKYVRRNGKVMVQTAYEHQYNRNYGEITGGEAKADLGIWKSKIKEDLHDKRAMFGFEDSDEALAEESTELEPEPPKIWPAYSQALQDGVDELVKSTDIARRFSIAMARSALVATRRIVEFGRIYRGNADPLMAQQEKYFALLDSVSQAKLLPYEALVMKQYWLCYGLALRGVLQWVGPRKRSRFVADFVGDFQGRARGYSPIDAAINYLHQRRLRQAERINQEVGFSGRCDGFLHKKRYNSRKIGLLLDMIDPFKFADREELLLVLLDRGLTWKDFRIETDRRGSNFYYPRDSAVSKLGQAGL
ncbi:MAG TPA: hypothetical protein VGR56_00865, partial [Nitrososphaerales archaeon]|nr:hypothetical protein [Nitrososphaerales archaeon]